MKLNDLNGQVQSLKTTHVECQFESLDGKVKRTVQAFTKSNVTNNLRPLSWNATENKWRHLNEIKFIKVHKCWSNVYQSHPNRCRLCWSSLRRNRKLRGAKQTCYLTDITLMDMC